VKITKKRKFIVAVSLAVLIAFGGCSASTITDVLAADALERAVNFGGGNNNNWVNNRAMFSEQDWNSRNELQRRFPYSQSDFSGRFATMGDWSMFNVNGFNNLEINLINGNVIFALNEDNMPNFFASDSVTERYRVFIVPNQIWVNGYMPSANNSTIYIIDNVERSGQNSTLTISVPRSDVRLFDSVNITVENGSVEIADAIEEFLAENLTITGDVVRVSDDNIVRFSPNTDTNADTNAQQRPNGSSTDEFAGTDIGESVPEVNVNHTRAADLIGTWESTAVSFATMEFRQDGIVISRFGYELSPLIGGIEGTWYVSGDLLTISKTATVFGITSQGTGTGRFEVTADNFRMYNQDGTYQDWIRTDR